MDKSLIKYPVSIIICIKNGEKEILQNKASWLKQLSEIDELILVNDFSSDNTLRLIEEIASENENVFVIECCKDLPGKKQAMLDGLNASKNEHILVTDVDCYLSPGWKKTMMDNWEDASFVLGFAPFFREKGFLNLFQRFEAVLTGIQYLSYAIAGSPYMGVGRNMGFKKSIFNVKPLRIGEMASGDDDLLVNAFANKENTNVCINKSSFVYSKAKPSWISFFKQKMRHVTTSVSYRRIHQIFLGLYSGTQILSNILFIFLIFGEFWYLALGGWVIKQLVIYFSVKSCNKLLLQKSLNSWIPILDFILTFYYLILVFVSPFKNKLTWS